MSDAGTSAWQPSLFAGAALDDDSVCTFDSSFFDVAHRDLGRGAWIDFVPGFATGGDVLFEAVLRAAPFRSEGSRRMYDQMVDVPRLTTFGWHMGRPQIFDQMALALGHRYGIDLVSISANLYRDGSDSVAWHGDRVGRLRTQTVVCILSLGSPRTLLLRPRGGGPSFGYTMHSGDLMIQGGTCQMTYEHCVPKRARSGPRISVMFRERFGN